MKRILTILIVVVIMTVSGICHAQGISGSGLIIVPGPDSDYHIRYSTSSAILNDPDSTLRYNPSGGTDNVAGAVDNTNYMQSLTVYYGVMVLASESIEIRLWGAYATNLDDAYEWVLFDTVTLTAKDVGPTFRSIEVEETPPWFRVSYNSTGTDSGDEVDIIICARGKAQPPQTITTITN